MLDEMLEKMKEMSDHEKLASRPEYSNLTHKEREDMEKKFESSRKDAKNKNIF